MEEIKINKNDVDINENDIKSEEIVNKITEKTSENNVEQNNYNTEEVEKAIEDLHKDEKLDLTDVIFKHDDDKTYLIPEITDEIVSTFTTVTLNTIDRDSVQVWVNLATSSISDNLIDYNKLRNELDKNDESYESYKESLISGIIKSISLLSSIQTDSKKIMNDFEENHVIESVTKNIIHHELTTYIFDKRKYRGVTIDMSQKEINDTIIKNEKEIVKELENNSFSYVLFKDKLESYENNQNKKFLSIENIKTLSHNLSMFVKQKMRNTKNAQNNLENLNISFANAFSQLNLLNFINLPVNYSIYRNFIDTVSAKDENKLKNIEKLIKNNGKFEFSDDIFIDISKSLEKLLNRMLVNGNMHLVNFMSEINKYINKDKKFKYVLGDLTLEDFDSYSKYNTHLKTKFFIEDDTNIYIDKIFRQFFFYDCLGSIYFKLKSIINSFTKFSQEKNDENFINLVEDVLGIVNLFCISIHLEIMNSDIYENVSKKIMSHGEERNIIQSIVTNSYIYQTYITSIFANMEDENTPEDKKIDFNSPNNESLYRYIKNNMTNIYNNIIIDESDDILFKKLKMNETRSKFYKLIPRIFSIIV